MTLIDALLSAAYKGDVARLKALLTKGANVNERNEVGYSALAAAARSYRVEAVEFLLGAGADPNAAGEDDLTVLHAAVGESPFDPAAQGKCVELLLEAGAKPNVRSSSGVTPLMDAAWFGCMPAVRALLAGGADVQLADNQGLTAAAMARQRGHAEVAAILEAG